MYFQLSETLFKCNFHKSNHNKKHTQDSVPGLGPNVSQALPPSTLYIYLPPSTHYRPEKRQKQSESLLDYRCHLVKMCQWQVLGRDLGRTRVYPGLGTPGPAGSGDRRQHRGELGSMLPPYSLVVEAILQPRFNQIKNRFNQYDKVPECMSSYSSGMKRLWKWKVYHHMKLILY